MQPVIAGREAEEAVQRAAAVVRARLGRLRPQVAVVLGSGLGRLAERVERPAVIPYVEIPGFPAPTVEGHQGELVAGTLEGVPVLMQSGRFHLYEGHDATTVALPTRMFAALRIRTLVVTNSAGGVRRTLRPPVLMLIADHVNLTWRNPLTGPVLQGDERFPDMSDPYDPELRRLAREAARRLGIRLEEGVYLGLLGPSYETPAEVRAFERVGVDAVGMSTVPEVVAARARGIRCLGISTITNLAAGIAPAPLSHQEVLAAGRQVAHQLERLVRAVLPHLAR